MGSMKKEIVLYYDIFVVIKRDSKYYVRDADIDSEWHEVELVKGLTEKEIKRLNLTDDKLYTYVADADYTGEDFYGTDYLYFKLVKGDKENGRND